MNDNEPQNTLTFGQMLDDDTHNQIKQLDEKLQKLLSNINAKKTILAQTHTLEADEKHKQLVALQTEVEKALVGITLLVNIVVTDRADSVAFTPNEQNKLAELREMLLDNTQKITEIEEALIL